MGNLTSALVFVVFLNGLLILMQMSLMTMGANINDICSYEGSLFKEYNVGTIENPTLTDKNIVNDLPVATGTPVYTSDTTWYTDLTRTIKSWFSDIGKGAIYIKSVVSAPYTMLSCIKIIPQQVVWVIGTAWYTITLLVIVGYIWGRE